MTPGILDAVMGALKDACIRDHKHDYKHDRTRQELARDLVEELDRAGYIVMRRAEVAPEQPMYSCGHRHPNRVEAADCLRGQLSREALRG